MDSVVVPAPVTREDACFRDHLGARLGAPGSHRLVFCFARWVTRLAEPYTRLPPGWNGRVELTIRGGEVVAIECHIPAYTGKR